MDVGTDLAQLLAQSFHVGVQSPTGDLRVVAPHLGQQLASVADFPWHCQKVQQKTHLERTHVNLAAIDEDLVGVGVNLEVADGDASLARRSSGCADVLVLVGNALGALPRLHAEEQLAYAERLDQVVISTHLESHHAVDLFTACGNHDHDRLRRLAAGANPSAHLQSRYVGQHEIQQNDVRWLGSRQPQCRCAVHRARHLVAGRFQIVGEAGGQIRLVLHQQDSSLAPARRLRAKRLRGTRGLRAVARRSSGHQAASLFSFFRGSEQHE